MKLIRILNRSIRDSFKSIFRNFSLSVASISCTIITLLLVSISIIISYNVTNITDKIEKDLTMIVFVDSSSSEEEINNIKKELENISNIESLTFRSKDEIKYNMGEENETLKNVMATWGDENPLESTFILKIKNLKKIKETAVTVKNIEKVTLVKYGESMVDKIINVFDMIRKICIIIVGALILVTAFLINNTIKITIFSRRNDINIMRLVGTSNLVIRLPFIFEGFLLGIIGSIIPILVTIFGYIYMYESTGGIVFSNLFELVKPDSIVYFTSLIILVIGSVVGMLGSSIAVRKYLKV